MGAKGVLVAEFMKTHAYQPSIAFAYRLLGFDAGDFKEEEHPRDESGKFASKGESEKSAEKSDPVKSSPMYEGMVEKAGNSKDYYRWRTSLSKEESDILQKGWSESGIDNPSDYYKQIYEGMKKSAPLKASTKQDMIEKIVGKYNYMQGFSHQAMLDLWRKHRKKSEELTDEIREKRNEADEELINIDPELGRSFSSMFEDNYSDKGKKLLKEIDELREEQKKEDSAKEYYSKQLDSERRVEHKKQKEKFQPKPLVETDKTDFEGFTLEPDVPYLRDKLEEGKAKIVEMSPKEYLQRCAYEIFEAGTLESQINSTETENVNKYAQMMHEGTKFHLPYLNYSSNGQEGRHRAIAAILNGIETMPVAIIGREVESNRNIGGMKNEQKE